jgi:hypothetical protein
MFSWIFFCTQLQINYIFVFKLAVHGYSFIQSTRTYSCNNIQLNLTHDRSVYSYCGQSGGADYLVYCCLISKCYANAGYMVHRTIDRKLRPYNCSWPTILV